MRNLPVRKPLYFGLLCILSAGIAHASTIFNLSTGTAAYTITADTITEAPDSSYLGAAIFVTTLPTGAFMHAASVTDGTDTSSQWVGPNAAQATEANTVSGNVTYTVQFNLTGYNLSTASLIMSIGADDFVSSIKLNGTTIFTPTSTEISGGMWGAGVTVPTVTTGFVAGTNTITFVVDNSTGDGSTSCCGPTALIAAVDVTATLTATPEPTTLGMTGLCLVGLAALIARRSRA